MLTPLQLINRIAQLVPPPRTHRHRYYGVLAPNSPLRAAVTAMAQDALPVVVSCPVADAACTAAGSAGGVPGVAGVPGVGAVLQPDCLPASVGEMAEDGHPALTLLRLDVGSSPLLARTTRLGAGHGGLGPDQGRGAGGLGVAYRGIIALSAAGHFSEHWQWAIHL
ncbi:hypothetical protein RA876_00740 [Rhodoferax antarcticus]|nr:hypothetical protein RA876_00740 [Rhodoferax antarcticus]